MKRITRPRLGFILSVVISLPLVAIAEEKPTAPPPVPKEVKEKKPEAGQVTKTPLYRPPQGLGAPSVARRVGGGTRGTNKSIPILCVLAPGHTGLTVREQPDFYWFASHVVTTPVEFTLILEKGDTPLVERRLPVPAHAGVQRVSLSEFGVKLMLGERYNWSIALVLDPKRRSKDILAMGIIERVERVELNPAVLGKAPTTDDFYRFAADGLWYDAVMAISEVIDAAPADLVLRKHRAQLLDEVDLSEVGNFDLTSQEGKAG
jgi:hypothetical protein